MFKLLPHSLGRTLPGLNKTHIVLPNIETILKPGEQELLQTQLSSPVDLREIDEKLSESRTKLSSTSLRSWTIYTRLNPQKPQLYIGLLE
jgi:hypothetical protein